MITNGINEIGDFINISKANRNNIYKCACCKETLVLKQGKIKQWHFAHISGSDCAHGKETELHFLAKKIIKEKGFILLPVPFAFKRTEGDYDIKNEYELFKVDNVFLEKRFHNIVPDIILEISGKRIIVEIYVTHSVDDVKYEKIQQLEIPTIEIDLSMYKNDSLVNIEKILYETDYEFEYLYNEKRDKLVKIINEYNFKIAKKRAYDYNLKMYEDYLKSEKDTCQLDEMLQVKYIDSEFGDVIDCKDSFISQKITLNSINFNPCMKCINLLGFSSNGVPLCVANGTHKKRDVFYWTGIYDYIKKDLPVYVNEERFYNKVY